MYLIIQAREVRIHDDFCPVLDSFGLLFDDFSSRLAIFEGHLTIFSCALFGCLDEFVWVPLDALNQIPVGSQRAPLCDSLLFLQ